MDISLPSEVTSSPINFTLLVNRDALQMRGPCYSEIFDYAKSYHKAIMEGDADLEAEARSLIVKRILVAIFNNEGQHNRLAEWALQAFAPEAIKRMLVNEGEVLKVKQTEAQKAAKKEAEELKKAKAHDAALKASYEKTEE